MNIAPTAAFYRNGIVADIIGEADAIAWADRLIVRGGDLPAEIFDLSLAASRGRLYVVEVLGALAGGPDSLTAVDGLLDIVRQSLFSGHIDLGTAVASIYRLSHVISVHDDLRWEMDSLNEDYALAVDGITGDVATMNGIVRRFLARFDGASDNYLLAAV